GGRPALAPNGRSLALALNSFTLTGQYARVGILDLRTGRHRVLNAEVPDLWILSLAFTPGGTRIVGTSLDATRVWDVASGKRVQTFATGRAGWPPSVAVDPRGQALVSSDQGSVSVWETSGGPAVGRRLWAPPPDGTCSEGGFVLDSRGRLAAAPEGDSSVA